MELHAALFAASVPHERKLSLTLDDGSVVEQVLYIRELTSLEMRRQVLAERSDDPKRVEMALADLIAKGLCDADAAPVMTTEQATRLKPRVAGQLRDLIMEVSGLGKPTGE